MIRLSVQKPSSGQKQRRAEEIRTYSPFRHLVITRLREFYREPAAVFWVYCFPLLLTFTLGLAFRADSATSYDVSIVETESKSKELVDLFNGDSEGRFQVRSLSFEAARTLLRTGKTELVLVPAEVDEVPAEVDEVPAEVDEVSGDRDGADGLAAGSGKDLVYWYDPRNQTSNLAKKAVDDFLQREMGRKDVLDAVDRIMDEPGGRYIDFLIPGLICMNIMGSGLWGVGFAIVDMRIRGLLKRFIATPMKRRDFMLSTMLSRLFFLVPEILLLMLVARFFFDVQIFGNLLLIIGLILFGSFQFAGISLMIACRAKTIETVSGLMNLVMLPNWIFAGIFFSATKFPDFVQWFIQLLPLTPLIDALRGVMLEGHTITDIAAQLAVMLVWTLASFLIALRFFRWS